MMMNLMELLVDSYTPGRITDKHTLIDGELKTRRTEFRMVVERP